MTDYQEALVLENLDLVNWVIRTRISIPNRPLLTYDDFYAIGCEAICRAALNYQPDTDRAMTSEEAAQLVKWVIDMALGPDASNVQVEPMENYPASSKMPLIISMAGVQQHLFWFYPQQSFEGMCDALSAMLGEIPISCDSIPA